MVMKPPPHSIDKHSTFDVDARPDNLFASRDGRPHIDIGHRCARMLIRFRRKKRNRLLMLLLLLGVGWYSCC
jgi:hypothetical protein